ncbi:MAG: AMP-binding protein [Bacteroidales bacterium]|nr:AMP-binding protein [Bacteroidales bacterium]
MGLENFLNDRITEEDSYKHTLPEILKTRALQTPDLTAYIFLRDGENDEEKITYRELDQFATSIAERLTTSNLSGKRALMLFPPGLEFVKALFGCFYAGVIAVPAYPPRKNRSLDRIRTLVVDSGASLIMSTEDIQQSFERSFSDITELKQLTWHILNSKFQIPNSNILSPNRQIAQSPNRQIAQSPNPAALALLQYTSGSTGQPKGVMVTHRNIMRNVEYIRQSFKLSRNSVSVTWLPSFHDMGLIDGVIEPVYTGFPGIIIPPVSFLQKPVRWLKAISKYKGTHSGGPNFAFDLCVDGITEEEKAGLDLSSMDTLYCGAEPIRRSTFKRFVSAFEAQGFRSGKLYPCYGMAETTLIISGPHPGRGPVYLGISGSDLEQHKITLLQEQDPDARYLVGVGYPWIDTDIRIVNPETFLHCREDEVGEIWVSGSIVTAGYWNKPEETEHTFAAEISDEPRKKYLRTGDLGFFHHQELYIAGRLKDLIIIHGRNYYPQDIEYLAEGCHPALRPNASAAFSVNIDEEERLVIVAEVERTALRDLDAVSVCDAIRHKIAEELELSVYAIQLLRTASILKTSSGKIQRKACKEGFLRKTLETVGESFLDEAVPAEVSAHAAANLVSIQAWLIAWIHTKLKISIEKIDPSRPIISYGLTSMKAVKLQQDFLDKYGVNFPPYLFFERISLKELAERAFQLIKEQD